MHEKRRPGIGGWLAALLLALAASGCGGAPDRQPGFESADAAAQALVESLTSDEPDALLALLGREYRTQLATGDWDAQAKGRRKIVDAAREAVETVAVDAEEVELRIGPDAWLLPIPLVLDEDGSWRFDTARGIEVIVDRRIGQNERAAIALARAYVAAQIEYASADRDGDGMLEYARRLESAPGQRDGVQLRAGPGAVQSPFGPLAEPAERDLETGAPGEPVGGYFFRVLERQGKNPRGGAYDYVVDGNMIAGFGLVAWPAERGSTGRMTFVVNHHGTVFQKDVQAPDRLNVYDPDGSWTEVPTR